jgi:hypothetical protein
MKPQSAKAKGRKFQQWVRDAILYEFSTFLYFDDVRSTSMGAGGEDILLSPRARRMFPYSIECKHRAAIAVYKDYEQASANAGEHEPVVFIKQNGSKPLAIVDAKYFIATEAQLQTISMKVTNDNTLNHT